MLGRKNHLLSTSGLFLFSGCLHCPQSPCLPLPPVQSLNTLGLMGGGVPRERHLGLAQRRCWLAKVECSIKSHLEGAPLPGTASSWTP